MTAPKIDRKETHLGDGLYASFTGYQIKLRWPEEHGDNEIYLEAPTIVALFEWMKTQDILINTVVEEP
jgi:hypothetical protein